MSFFHLIKFHCTHHIILSICCSVCLNAYIYSLLSSVFPMIFFCMMVGLDVVFISFFFIDRTTRIDRVSNMNMNGDGDIVYVYSPPPAVLFSNGHCDMG